MYELCDLYELYDLAHVDGWGPCNLHGLERVFWVVLAPFICCTFTGRLGSIDDLSVDDLSVNNISDLPHA